MMKINREKCEYFIENISENIIRYITIFILSLIIFTGLFWPNVSLKSSILIIVIFIGTIAIYYILKKLIKIEDTRLIYLVIIALAIRLIWIFSYNVEPESDYKNFYNFAVYLKSTGLGIGTEKWKYIALFKHIFGYSSFLAILFSIFGISVLVGQLANVFLSIISLILIYKISLKVVGKEGAFIASILWAFYPSQIIYNIFLLSEPLWVTILLLIFYTFIKLDEALKENSYKKSILYLIIISILCVWMNTIRPISMVIIIMIFIWMFILNIKKIESIRDLITRVIGIVLVFLIFITGSNITNKLIEYKILLKPTNSYGWSFYVGLNEESYGGWNEKDWELLYTYLDSEEYTVQEVQDIMMEHAKEKIMSGNINFGELFLKKIKKLWGSDSAAVLYLQENYTFYGIFNKNILSATSYIYYYATIIFSLLGLIKIKNQQNNKLLILFTLYFLGITFAHLLIEVAGRYHYSGIICFILLSAYFICKNSKKDIV